MRVYTDDDLYRIDRTYLGPKGKRIPWRVSYRGYGVWFATVLVLGTITYQLLPINFYTVVAVLYGSLALSIKIMAKLDADRPLTMVPLVAWHELSAPRPDRRPVKHVIEVKAVRYPAGAEPDTRWWHRLRRTKPDELDEPAADEDVEEDAA